MNNGRNEEEIGVSAKWNEVTVKFINTLIRMTSSLSNPLDFNYLLIHSCLSELS